MVIILSVLLTIAVLGLYNQAAPPQFPTTIPPEELERPQFNVVNAHDHLYKRSHLDKYLAAAEETGVTQTIFVASSRFTIMGTSGKPNQDNELNTREILNCAQEFPDKIIPFCTLHPDDENKVDLLKNYVAEGIKGLKLYTGHSNFYDRPLDAPEMLPVYAYCEEVGLPILWHVNLLRYTNEFTRVMLKFPNLKVILPHIGVAFWRPTGQTMTDIQKMLDIYPNLYVDTSFGTREILVGGLEKVNQNPQVFRDFYEKNQDKIVWGTDMVVTGNKEKTQRWVASVIRACRNMHERSEYTFWMAASGSKYADKRTNNIYGKLRGLNLPNDILKKVYETNIAKILN